MYIQGRVRIQKNIILLKNKFCIYLILIVDHRFLSFKREKKWPTNELLHLHLLLLQTTGVDFLQKSKIYTILWKCPNNHVTANLFRVSNLSNFKSVMADIDKLFRKKLWIKCCVCKIFTTCTEITFLASLGVSFGLD